MDWEIYVGRQIGQVEQEYPDFTITLTAFDCMARDFDFKLLAHTVARWVLATKTIDVACVLDAGQMLQALCGQILAKLFAQGVDFVPQRLTEIRVQDLGLDASPHKVRTNGFYFF